MKSPTAVYMMRPKELTQPEIARLPAFHEYMANHYSQNGEDGILSEIFNRLKIDVGCCVEFGAWDGIYLSNTRHFLEHGWSGLLIEGDSSMFGKLVANCAGFAGRVICLQEWVAADGDKSLDSILRGRVPQEFELLSIDIDGGDYYIFESLVEHRPMVVVIEINSSYPPEQEVLPVKGAKRGCSFLAMKKLGEAKGYVALCHTGNMIFIRADLAYQVGFKQDDPVYDDTYRRGFGRKRSKAIVRLAGGSSQNVKEHAPPPLKSEGKATEELHGGCCVSSCSASSFDPRERLAWWEIENLPADDERRIKHETLKRLAGEVELRRYDTSGGTSHTKLPTETKTPPQHDCK
jgi:hypothetical protein